MCVLSNNHNKCISNQQKYGVNEQQSYQSNGQCNSKTTVKYKYLEHDFS